MNKTGVNIPILMYHHIGKPAIKEDEPFFVSGKRFKRQMRFLKKEGYDIISLLELAKGFKDGGPLPKKPAIITFDDGTESVYTSAFPILRLFNFKATIFLAVNYIDKREMTGKLFLKYKALSWQQIEEMQAYGISFYPHSLTHPHLTKVNSSNAHSEITESKKILESKLGSKSDFFAYPYGESNEEIRKMVKNAGYLGAVDARGGINAIDTDIFNLKRIPVFDGDTNLQLKLKLTFGAHKVT